MKTRAAVAKEAAAAAVVEVKEAEKGMADGSGGLRANRISGQEEGITAPFPSKYYRAQVSLRNKLSIVTKIVEKLTPTQRELFEKSCFGPWLKVRHQKGDPLLTHMFLQRLTKDLPEGIPHGDEEMWFHFPPSYARFGREEFCLITGLRFGRHDDIGPYIRHLVPPLWLSRVFSRPPTKIYIEDLIGLLDTRMGDSDFVRVCLLLLLYVGFLGKDDKKPIHEDHISLADDLDAWNAFPWGSFLWKSTWRNMSIALEKVGHRKRYELTGFVWAFKIWIFEAFPSMRDYAFKNPDDINVIPRAITWERIKEFDFKEIIPFLRIDDVAEYPRQTLTPTEAEAATVWWQASRRFFDGTDDEDLPFFHPSPRTQDPSRDDAVKHKESATEEVDILRGELQQAREDREILRGELQQARMDREHLLFQVQELTEEVKKQKRDISCLQDEVFKGEALRKKQKRDISYLQDEVFKGEALRKKQHNTIMELKGNIRVFCRVRPFLPNDSEAKAAESYPFKVGSAGRGIELIQSGQRFTFDQVFEPNASQQDVFMEISQLVQSALDGYKVCIFAYGQTGSGKTYTMMGRPEAPLQGLIPRSLEQVFETTQALAAKGWRYKMQVSVLEIYKETIRDLLLPRSIGRDVSRAEVSGLGKQYTIRHDEKGNTYVSNLTIVDVCSSTEVSDLLQQAAHSRSVAKTDMNEHSSRSHFVVTLRIYGEHESTEQQAQGVLNLVDLAGSERLSSTGVSEEREQETKAINKSLSSLRGVITALAKKQPHVPSRDSKLTYLLQPCFGGNSKTLMFVNVSPDPSSVGESLNSLRFAAMVNSCEIGSPHPQTNRPLDSRLTSVRKGKKIQ